MKFGYLENTTDVNFALPLIEQHNLDFLKSLQTNKPFKLHIGGSKWGIKQYVGSVYPKGTRPGDYLEHYSRFFNSIELNASGYGLRMLDSLEKWLDKVPDGFTFSPKFPRKVSHYRRLTGEGIDSAHDFVERIKDFNRHLGIPFLQMTDNFAPTAIENLEVFVHEMTDLLPFAVELRHADWYTSYADEVIAILRAHQVTWVMTDTPGRRDVLHSAITSPRLFVRFSSTCIPEVDELRLINWAERIQMLKGHGLHEACFYIHAKKPELVPRYYSYLKGLFQ